MRELLSLNVFCLSATTLEATQGQVSLPQMLPLRSSMCMGVEQRLFFGPWVSFRAEGDLLPREKPEAQTSTQKYVVNPVSLRSIHPHTLQLSFYFSSLYNEVDVFVGGLT
jgi:hypothetical protein